MAATMPVRPTRCQSRTDARSTIRRLLRVVTALVVLVVLAGCKAAGTVEVRSAQEVAVDLTFSNFSGEGNCNASALRDPKTRLAFDPGVDEQGRATCRVHGTAHPEELRFYADVTHAGELLAVGYNPAAMSPNNESDPDRAVGYIYWDLDVLVTFPGEVLSGTGIVNGNSIRFTDAKQLGRGYGLTATALDHVGPSWSTVGPIVGVLAGLALVGVWSSAIRRRRVAGPAQAEKPAEGPLPSEVAPSDRLSSEASQSDWLSSRESSRSGRDASVAESFAFGTSTGDGFGSSEPVEPQKQRPTKGAGQDRFDGSPADDSRWAPPPD